MVVRLVHLVNIILILTIPSSDISFSGGNTDSYVNFTDGQNNDELILTDIQVKHQKATGNNKDYHGVPDTQKANLGATHECSEGGASGDPQNKWHPWNTSGGSNTFSYTLQSSGDNYYGINPSGTDESTSLTATTLQNFDLSANSGKNKPTIKYSYYQNWFQKNPKITIVITAGTSSSDSGQPANKTPDEVTCDGNTSSTPDGWFWNLVWISAIFYILCIQIFMTMLHYPDSLLSCFFNNKYHIGFISILFNTLREIMQTCGFSGAGKQVNTPNNTGTLLLLHVKILVLILLLVVIMVKISSMAD